MANPLEFIIEFALKFSQPLTPVRSCSALFSLLKIIIIDVVYIGRDAIESVAVIK